MKPDRKTIDDVLLDQMLEFILEAPEDEFLQYVVDCGEDPVQLGREGRDAIAAALKRYGKTKLRGAREQHDQQKQRIEKLRRDIPIAYEDKRLFFARLVKTAQLSGHKVSYQNRNLKDPAAEDLDLVIAELLVLLKSSKDK